jgi:hypothetical protein
MAIDFMGFINAEVPEGWDAAKKQRLRDSFVYQNGYTDTVENPEGGDPIPNPVSKNDFGNQVLTQFIVNCIKAWEATMDSAASRLAAIADVEAEFGGDWNA